VKNRLDYPEASPGILIGSPTINNDAYQQLSRDDYKLITFQIILITKGGNEAVSQLHDLYEDFFLSFNSDIENRLLNNGVECDGSELGRFVPMNELFGNAQDNILNGDLSLNIKIK
jgi:hypothetical protein